MNKALINEPMDMMDPVAVADPEAYFGKLRDADPIHWNEKHKMWIVTRYEDVVWAARQPDLFSSDKLGFHVKSLPKDVRGEYKEKFSRIYETYPSWLSSTDNPVHDHIRLIVNQVWTPSQVEKRRLKIRGFINVLLDRAEEKGEIDFIKDFTLPLPIQVILDFLDFPHEDWKRIKEYSDKWIGFHFGGGPEIERWQAGLEGIQGLTGYARPRVDERAEAPTDDYISALLQAEWKGDRLTKEEVVVHCANLLFSGHETTTNLLANGLHLLLRNPGEWARVCKDTAIIPSAVEEIIRQEGAIKSMLRYALDDVELKGKKIKKGELVLLVISSANNDSEKFNEPHTTNVCRRPNAHVGFGQGIHICLGAPLARLEAQEAYRAIAERFPSIHLATDTFEYHSLLRGRALKALPVKLK